MFHIYESLLVTKFLLLLLPSHVPRFTYVVAFLTCRSSSCSWQFSFWFHLHNLLWDSVFIDLYLWVCRILPCHLYTLHITHMNMYTIYTHICTCTNKQTNKLNVKYCGAHCELHIKLYTNTSVGFGHVKDELQITISETYYVRMHGLWSLSSETILQQVFKLSLTSLIAKKPFLVEPTFGNIHTQNESEVIKLTNSPALLTSNNYNAIELFETMEYRFWNHLPCWILWLSTASNMWPRHDEKLCLALERGD